MKLTLPVAVVASALLLGGVYVGYQEYQYRRLVADLNAVPVPTFDYKSSADTPQSLYRGYVSHVVPKSVDTSRVLTSSERCVGGVVIHVEGSSYTQTGEHCAGSRTVAVNR